MSCSPKVVTQGSVEALQVLVTGKVNGVYIDLPSTTTNLEILIVDAGTDPLVSPFILPFVWEQMGRNYWATAVLDSSLLAVGDYDYYVRFTYSTETPLLKADNLLTVV